MPLFSRGRSDLSGPAPKEETRSIRSHLDEIESLAKLYFGILLGISATYAAGSAFWLQSWAAFPTIIGLALIVIACWAVAGGVLGFLFGIPRLLQRWAAPSPPGTSGEGKAAEGKEVARRYLLSNSNLEDISDWLTKIIVGLGLINLTKMPTYIDLYGNAFVRSTQFLGQGGLGGAYAFFILLTGAAGGAGFLFFYIQTRTRITLLLVSIEEAQDSAREKLRTAAESQQFQTPADTARPVLTAVAPKTRADPDVLLKTPSLADSAAVWAAWAAAKVRSDELSDAERGWKIAVSKDSQNPLYRERLAEVFEYERKFAEASEWYGLARAVSGDSPELRERELIASLYTPGKFEKSISLVEDLIANDLVGARNPWVKIWQIAAYGQKHAALASTDKEAAQIVREKVRDLIKEFVARVPDPTVELRRALCRMLDPETYKGEPEDNDLVSFKHDDEIVSLLGCVPP